MKVNTQSEWFTLQHQFARWLVDARVARVVTEVPDIDRAPLVYTPAGRRVQPDLVVDLAYERRTVWIDSKGKSQTVLYGNSQRRRTGIDWDELQAYREVESLSTRPCLVAFIHVREREVRYVAVNSALWQRGHDAGGDMAFVDYDPLALLAKWNGKPKAPEFELATDALVVLPAGVQMAMDGIAEVPTRRTRKGYATLPGRAPTGVKGWPKP